jgi:hypothetical protein
MLRRKPDRPDTTGQIGFVRQKTGVDFMSYAQGAGHDRTTFCQYENLMKTVYWEKTGQTGHDRTNCFCPAGQRRWMTDKNPQG